MAENIDVKDLKIRQLQDAVVALAKKCSPGVFAATRQALEVSELKIIQLEHEREDLEVRVREQDLCIAELREDLIPLAKLRCELDAWRTAVKVCAVRLSTGSKSRSGTSEDVEDSRGNTKQDTLQDGASVQQLEQEAFNQRALQDTIADLMAQLNEYRGQIAEFTRERDEHITQCHNLIVERDETRAEKQSVDAERVAALQEKDAVLCDLSRLKSSLDSLLDQRDAAEALAASSAKVIEELQSEITDVRSMLDVERTAANEVLETSRNTATIRYNELALKHDAARQEVVELQRNLERIQEQYAKENDDLKLQLQTYLARESAIVPALVADVDHCRRDADEALKKLTSERDCALREHTASQAAAREQFARLHAQYSSVCDQLMSARDRANGDAGIIRERDLTISARDDTLARLNQSLQHEVSLRAKQDADINSLRRELAKTGAEKSELEHKLRGGGSAQVEELKRSNLETSKRLETVREQFSSLQAQLGKAVLERDKMIHDLGLILVSRDNSITLLNQTIASERDKNASLVSSTKNQLLVEQKLRGEMELRFSLAQRQAMNRIEDLERTQAENQKSVAALRNHETELQSRLDAVTKERDGTILELRGAVGKAEQEVKRLEALLAERDSEISRQKIELGTLRNNVRSRDESEVELVIAQSTSDLAARLKTITRDRPSEGNTPTEPPTQKQPPPSLARNRFMRATPNGRDDEVVNAQRTVTVGAKRAFAPSSSVRAMFDLDDMPLAKRQRLAKANEEENTQRKRVNKKS